IEKGNFGFVDSLGGKLEGHTKLVCQLTVRDGLVLWDLNGLANEDWRKNRIVRPLWEGQPPTKK
ncbi:unnamed protein product, partial [marine sediment metagenome]